MRNHISFIYAGKTTGKIILLHILIFGFLDGAQEGK